MCSVADVAFEMPEDSVTEGDSSISVCVHLVDGALTSLGQILMISSREQEALGTCNSSYSKVILGVYTAIKSIVERMIS